MAIYLTAYDLVKESNGSADYQPLWDELMRLGAHRTQKSLWLVSTSLTAKELVEHLSGFVDEDDRIWATRVRRNEYYYINALAGTNKWLEQNPPS